MTDKDKSTIQRNLGKIEAVAVCAKDNDVAEVLLDALNAIDIILDREEGVEK